MNILITGGNGFVGNNLIKHLQDKMVKEDKIVVLCSKEPKIKNEKCIYIYHNNWGYSVDDFYKVGIDSIDVVVLLGWFVARNKSEKENYIENLSPLRSIYYVLGHLPCLLKKVVFVSSTSVYGFEDEGAISETSKTIPADIYGAVKLIAENIVKKWSYEKGIKCQVLRLGPVYGPGDQRTEFLLEKLIYASAYGEHFRLDLSTSTRRNYIYVADVCSMLIESIYSDSEKTVNIVADESCSFKEIIEALKKCNNDFHVECAESIKENDILFNCSLRHKEFKTPITPIEVGISETIDWILLNKK